MENESMIFGLSGLKRDELRRILREMKALCAKEEEEALKHLDVQLKYVSDLINEAQEADDSREKSRSERADAKEAIFLFESELSRAERLLTEVRRNKIHYPTWASDFEKDARNLGADWSEETKRKHELEIGDLRTRAFTFAKSYRRKTVEDFQKRLNEIERSLDGGVSDNVWELPSAEGFIRDLDSSWDEELKKQCSAEYQILKSRAIDIEGRAATAYHMKALSEALENPPSSTARVKSLLKKLRAAESFFDKIGKLNAELGAQFKSAMESLAWQRARKMLDDAEVAEAGGNSKKYLKLRAQAKVALRQDWVRILGHKAMPNFDSMPEFKEL